MDNGTRTRTYLKRYATRLVRITAGCRDDMHEPDEQGVTAKVTGRVFDNAGFETELRVTISRDGYHETFDLAGLVALARLGAKVL